MTLVRAPHKCRQCTALVLYAIARATLRRFFKHTIFYHCKKHTISVQERTQAIGNVIIFETVTFSSRQSSSPPQSDLATEETPHILRLRTIKIGKNDRYAATSLTYLCDRGLTCITNTYKITQEAQNIYIACIQCRHDVEDVGPTLYKCYTNVLCLLGRLLYARVFFCEESTSLLFQFSIEKKQFRANAMY